MLWASYPPGADIGLHNSVINSITQSGNTNFLWNNYQMGGGLSLTFPGFHIFAAGIIMMTGMSDYLAQAVIVALFSSLLVICAFLITKSVWVESGAFIVAFLVAVSRPDMEILLWAGYPNIITLLLIPLTFYLYLQKDRFTLTPFLASTSILVGSIYLTHSLSAAVFRSHNVGNSIDCYDSSKNLWYIKKKRIHLADSACYWRYSRCAFPGKCCSCILKR